jgi:hypothetical protein
VAIDYLNPQLPPGLRRVRIPVVEATAESLAGLGCLVEDPDAQKIEIVRWPSTGRRPVDDDSGDEGGTTSGIFTSAWDGDVLFGRNQAVGGHYILGYGTEPTQALLGHARPPERLLLWHANYHSDGGQLFFPIDPKPFLVPLAPPGDDIRPEHFICFRFSGRQGLYIHPNIWHEGVFAIAGSQRFLDRQGAVHARVSVEFGRELGCLLEVSPL